jgi:hypothetical protein
MDRQRLVIEAKRIGCHTRRWFGLIARPRSVEPANHVVTHGRDGEGTPMAASRGKDISQNSMTELEWTPDDVPSDQPSAVRMYDYDLGGHHNFEIDRRMAAASMKISTSGRQRRSKHARGRRSSHFSMASILLGQDLSTCPCGGRRVRMISF